MADTSTMDIDLAGVSVIDETEEDDMVDDSVNVDLGYSYVEYGDSVYEGIVKPEQAQSLDPVFIPLDENMVAEDQLSSVDRPRRVPTRIKKPMDDQFVFYK